MRRGPATAVRDRWRARRARPLVLDLVAAEAFEFVFQPIIDLRDGHTVGYEGLTRFPSDPAPVDAVFARAGDEGVLLELELHAIAGLLDRAATLPTDGYVSVNASPSTVTNPRLRAVLERFPLHRLVLEVTEREAIPDYSLVQAALAELRTAGLRLAVDDAGAGEASLRHLIGLRPDIIKLDAMLTDALDSDPGQRAMARALVAFAAEMGATVVAEGVETASRAAELAELGVDHGQGWALGRPQPAPASP